MAPLFSNCGKLWAKLLSPHVMKMQSRNKFSIKAEEEVFQLGAWEDTVISASEPSSLTLLTSSYHSVLINLLYIDKLLGYPYRSEPAFVPRSAQGRQMLPDHSGYGSLGSNKSDTAGHDDHAGCIPRAAYTHDQENRKLKNFRSFHLRRLWTFDLLAYLVVHWFVTCQT